MPDDRKLIKYRNVISKDTRCLQKFFNRNLQEQYSYHMLKIFQSCNESHSFLVSTESFLKKEIIAGVLARIDTEVMYEDKERIGYIGMLAVDKKYRRNGIAAILITKVLQSFASSNINKIYLECAHDSSAVLFYEKMGFVKIDYFENYYVGNIHAFKMFKYIESRDYFRDNVIEEYRLVRYHKENHKK